MSEYESSSDITPQVHSVLSDVIKQLRKAQGLDCLRVLQNGAKMIAMIEGRGGPGVDRLAAIGGDLVLEQGVSISALQDILAKGVEAGIKAREAQEGEPEGAWLNACVMNAKGTAAEPILANAIIGVRRGLRGRFAYDEMLRAVVLPDADYRPLRDEDETHTQDWLQHQGLTKIGKAPVSDAIAYVARENSYHPLRDWLRSLVWDGVTRLERLLPAYFGTDDTAYERAIGRMFLVSMVARIGEPGCKCDHMVILEGAQGTRKSTACAILGGEWFSDSLAGDLAHKDSSAHLRGRWLIEIPEMSTMTKAETSLLKAFITRQVERYRPSYGRNEVHEPRQVVFVGTTNREVYLKDETGGRRFWPVKTGAIDTERLAIDREQLFAEAVHIYRERGTWWPDGDFERQWIAPQQEARFEVDPWEAFIAEALVGEVCTTISGIAGRMGVYADRLGTAEQRRITAALQRLGWVRGAKDSITRRQMWVRKPQ